MAIQILTSFQDAYGYFNNLAYLQSALNTDAVAFKGPVNNYAPVIVFDNTARVYDFTRKAGSRVREDMTTYLNNVKVPPGLQMGDVQKIRAAFDCLFNYYEYKGNLEIVTQKKSRSISMLIFNHAQQYVAHVYFNSTSVRTGPQQFDVNVALTCQRYTYFPMQQTNYEAVLEALQNLHV